MWDPFTLMLGIVLGICVGILGMFIYFQRKQRQMQELQVQQAASLAASREHLLQREQELARIRDEQQQQQGKLMQIAEERGQLKTAYEHLRERFTHREQEITELHQQFKLQFEHLANEALEKNAKHLSHNHQSQLNLLLQPLKEKLQGFEKKVEETYEKEARERIHLQKEIELLMNLNQQVSQDAQNLAKALRGDSKVQGNWGELVLNRILESCGLRKGQEFEVQESHVDAFGKRAQPDVVVHLPDHRHLIIDAKVSLTAFERVIATDNPDEQNQHLNRHLDSIQTHIKQLSARHYQDLEPLHSPDFVLMFLPVEPAFTLALQARSDLFHFAWERKIVLVSPSTLLATLKTVASIWQMEQQNKNAVEIARQGGLLYDKFVGFVEDLEKVGDQLEKATHTYENAMRKLKIGPGNLITKATKLKHLGAKTRKDLEA